MTYFRSFLRFFLVSDGLSSGLFIHIHLLLAAAFYNRRKQLETLAICKDFTIDNFPEKH